MLEKQKQLKAKYTVVEKKKDSSKISKAEPSKVEWRKVDPTLKGVSVPAERIQEPALDSDEEESGVESEYELTEVRTLGEVARERESVRNRMLGKSKLK